MKIKLTYLMPFLAILLVTACTKSDYNAPTVTLPTGTFIGQFMRIRRNPTTTKLDTVKANLNLSLSQTTGFQITGDTSTLHAGSKGSYAANAYYMQFIDQTYVATQPFTKYHLSGVYNYTYDGSNLKVFISYADTLSLQYAFKKSN
jgi:hypothetical protein